MIHLFTGLPGAGKTLRMIQEVKAYSEKEGRPVFYAGVEILDLDALPWHKLEDEQKWYELPDGAIIIIDEAQRLFRPRANGSQVPQYVSELETHRHKGYDIFITTQHPLLVDGNLRRLTGRHMHVIRMLGMRRSSIHEFTQCRDNCDKSQKDSVLHTWSYPKEIIGTYKSTTIDTHKARIPMKFWVVLSIPFIIAALVYWAYSWVAGYNDRMTSKIDPAHTASAVQGMPVQQQIGGAEQKARALTPAEWMAQQQARIPGLPQTAPVYDQLTAPQQVPAPQACVTMGNKCKCFTQQATPIDMDQDMCKQIVKNGIFLPHLPDAAHGGSQEDLKRQYEQQQKQG